MPPNSRHLWEEGMCVKSFFLVKDGSFQEEGELLAYSFEWVFFSVCMQAKSSPLLGPFSSVSAITTAGYGKAMYLQNTIIIVQSKVRGDELQKSPLEHYVCFLITEVNLFQE